MSKVNVLLSSIADSDKFRDVSYLCFSIPINMTQYIYRSCKFEVPEFLKELSLYVKAQFGGSGLTKAEVLQYMVSCNNEGALYLLMLQKLKDVGGKECFDEEGMFHSILIGFLLDNYNNCSRDIIAIQKMEQLTDGANKYGLSNINHAKFGRSGIILGEHFYLYNIFTSREIESVGATMPIFARIISKEAGASNVLYRLDKCLSLPKENEIGTILPFAKFYGPNFDFDNVEFEKKKTITVHGDEFNNKLLLVVKKQTDDKGEEFLHIELEVLPCMDNVKKLPTFMQTIFLHGMYYPKQETFAHIDFTMNQYDMKDYFEKHKGVMDDKPIDMYTSKDGHYKIWCIEGGQYSKDMWYKLMKTSIPIDYGKLLDEILKKNK